ncbi:MAG: Glutathione-regulated potassium-efflux system protein KefC [Phycisphaerales bacterium]|nr:Glutathione-regulated potassium-efflux system protein KefC [Phycisphaerales bacterium]
MERTDTDQLRLRPARLARLRERLFREWCFVVAVVRHRGLSLLLLVLVIAGGSELLWRGSPDPRPPLFDRVYGSWNLVFGQPPAGSLPESWVGRAMLFVIPLLGLAFIIEAIVEVSAMLRDRRSNERSWCLIMSRSMKDHVILVGLGKLGFRTFKLLRRLGHRVVVIEATEKNKFLDEVRRDGSALLIGDARHDELLRDAGVEKARSIILATSDDMVNLEAALDARRMNPGIRVVLRMFDQQLADKVREGFNIRVAMSQSSISAPAFATAAVEPSIVGSVVLSSELIVMVRWPVQTCPQLAGQSVGDVLATFGVSVVERVPPGAPRQLFPPPATVISSGDELVLQGEFTAVMALRSESAAATPA